MRNWKILAVVLAGVVAYAIVVSLSAGDGGLRREFATGPADGAGLDTSEPCEGVAVAAGDDLAAIANASPTNTTFCISGIQRLSSSIVPKDGQRFIGVGGPVLSGSRALTSFAREGDSWVVSDQTQDYSMANERIADEPCMDGNEGCRFPEDVYVDDEFLHQVLSLDDLESGMYFFDYGADRIYLAEDPAGRKVEASVVRRAFANYHSADDVLVRGLVIEKFSAYAGQDGALGAFQGTNWLVEDNEIRLNHGSGIAVGGTDRMVIRRNYIHDNGCGGINGPDAHNILISGNEIAFNNAQNYLSYAWSCGGGKLVRAEGLIFRHNYSHHNNGFGFWTDSNNVNVVYEDNTFEDNTMGGVMHEINDGNAGPTVILDNVFRRNGFGHPNRVMMGAAIVISASSHVEIVGNILQDNAHGITLNYSFRDLPGGGVTVHDIVVRDNVIGLRYGKNPSSDVGRVGFYTSTVGGPAPERITFDDNHYFLGDSAGGQHFSLADTTSQYALTTATDWQAAGFDTSSEFEALSEFPSQP
jgi:Right handed beta helix region